MSFEKKGIRNYHTHTTRCLHATDSDETYVKTAIQQGFKTLGFSDHTPLPYTDGYVSRIRMPLGQLPEYVSSIRSLQEKYQDQIEILLGLECEPLHQYLSWYGEIREQYHLDYLILGNHVSEAHEHGHFFQASKTPDELKRYTDMTLEGMESGLFAYLCHPEVAWSNYPVFDTACLQMAETICRRAKELNMPLEYNLQGNYYRENGNYHGIGYPCDDFWKVAAGYQNLAIVGIDAHHANMLEWTDRFTAAQEHLKGMGLTVLDTLPV
ncbi:MAG: histidinol-phosphatase [Clostridia bacterium]|nr:histidinol-phosphatase [Clostridia bacterium]